MPAHPESRVLPAAQQTLHPRLSTNTLDEDDIHDNNDWIDTDDDDYISPCDDEYFLTVDDNPGYAVDSSHAHVLAL